jgi:hypothetical protein
LFWSSVFVGAEVENGLTLSVFSVTLGIHVFEEFLCLGVFKDRLRISPKMNAVLFAERGAKHGATSLVEESSFAAYTWGTADNTAMLVDFGSLRTFEAFPSLHGACSLLI